ncbi:hypothetical protein [Vibrio phage vB_VhaS-a]|nr:hypothetical protein [Vibrio phage vB_VhaS-a]
MADKTADSWYEKNKDTHNRNRRDRYQNDPEYREAIQQRARERARERREARKGEEPVITRELNGVNVRVFRHSEVAEMCGVSPRKMKADELKGKIPNMSFEGRNRVYTEAQRDLLISFYSGDMTADQLRAAWS